ncbi:surface-adhesin E family protein [Chromobacterium sphagni]|uniref:surface-adhesin E family protein n=1 Tax=Chromobacterium sphagni TaxID=1903179 RepID=UPI001113ED1E|nr:surface-adhesin E family protein [Chromobacterium sphagni]
MKKILIAMLALASSGAFAASWSSYNGTINHGSLLVDADSISDTNGSMKFWTIFSPTIDTNQPSAGYSYNMTLRQINCSARTVTYVKTIFYDYDQIPQDIAVSDKSSQDIIPDSENDYLWKYVCKPSVRKELWTSVNNVPEYLLEHTKTAKIYSKILPAKQAN